MAFVYIAPIQPQNSSNIVDTTAWQHISDQLHKHASAFSDAARSLLNQQQQIDWSIQDMMKGWKGTGSENFKTAWQNFAKDTSQNARALDDIASALTTLAQEIDKGLQQAHAANKAESATQTADFFTLGFADVIGQPIAQQKAQEAVTTILNADSEAAGKLEGILGEFTVLNPSSGTISISERTGDNIVTGILVAFGIFPVLGALGFIASLLQPRGPVLSTPTGQPPAPAPASSPVPRPNNPSNSNNPSNPIPVIAPIPTPTIAITPVIAPVAIITAIPRPATTPAPTGPAPLPDSPAPWLDSPTPPPASPAPWLDSPTPPPDSPQAPPDGSNSQPPNDGSNSQPPNDGSNSQSPNDGNNSQPPNDGGNSQPPNDGSNSQPPNDGSNSQPPNDGSNSQPPNDGNGGRPPGESDPGNGTIDLGEETWMIIDQLEQSEVGRHALEVQAMYHVTVVLGQAGRGTRYNPSSNTVFIDPTNPSPPDVQLVHELTHAEYYRTGIRLDPRAVSQEDYVRSMVNEEVDATVNEVHHIQRPGSHANYHPRERTIYEAAYNQALLESPGNTQAAEEAGRQAIYDAFENGTFRTGTTGTPYPQYYADAWARVRASHSQMEWDSSSSSDAGTPYPQY